MSILDREGVREEVALRDALVPNKSACFFYLDKLLRYLHATYSHTSSSPMDISSLLCLSIRVAAAAAVCNVM